MVRLYDPSPMKKGPKSLDPGQTKRLCALYKDLSISIMTISKRFGVSDNTIHKVATDNGLTRRPAPRGGNNARTSYADPTD